VAGELLDAITGRGRRGVTRNLRLLRNERGLSLGALAGRAGISRGMLLQIEQQRVSPSLATLVRVPDALDSSVNELVDLGASDAPFREAAAIGDESTDW
jgi:transcriptional regulator with XRE-family HTH domain